MALYKAKKNKENKNTILHLSNLQFVFHLLLKWKINF